MLSGALNAAGALMMSEPGSAASSDLHDGASPLSRSSSGDDLPDDTLNGPSRIYSPHSVDYCNALRRDYCTADSGAFQSSSTHAQPEVGWPSHFRSPQFASLMVAAAAGAMLPVDTHTVSSIV